MFDGPRLQNYGDLVYEEFYDRPVPDLVSPSYDRTT